MIDAAWLERLAEPQECEGLWVAQMEDLVRAGCECLFSPVIGGEGYKCFVLIHPDELDPAVTIASVDSSGLSAWGVSLEAAFRMACHLMSRRLRKAEHDSDAAGSEGDPS